MFAVPLAYVDMMLLGVGHMVMYTYWSFQIIDILLLCLCVVARWDWKLVRKTGTCFLHRYLAFYATLVGECIEPFGPPMLTFALSQNEQHSTRTKRGKRTSWVEVFSNVPTSRMDGA